MKKQFEKSDQTFSLGFPKNRYAALEGVQSFFEFYGVSLKNLFEVLCKGINCYLTFSFSDIMIEFSRGFRSEHNNMVDLCVYLQGENKPYMYEYKVEECEAL